MKRNTTCTLSEFSPNLRNGTFWFLVLILSEHFWAFGVKHGTIFQHGRRRSVNTNAGAMEWFRGYFQSMNGRDRKWEIVRGMRLVGACTSKAIWQHRGNMEYVMLCRNRLLLQFTINRRFPDVLAACKETILNVTAADLTCTLHSSARKPDSVFGSHLLHWRGWRRWAWV